MLTCIYNLREGNFHSISVLHACLKQETNIENLQIIFLSPRDRYNQKPINIQNKKVVYIDSFMSGQRNQARKALENIKNKLKNKKATFLAGGADPSASPKNILKMGFDIVNISEGEKTFPLLVNRILKGKNWRDINGIAYLRKNKFITNPLEGTVDLNNFPPFSENLRPTVESFVNFEDAYTPIEIVRGCPWGCKFCQTPYLMGRKRRFRTIENIKKNVKRLLKYEDNIRFLAPNILAYGSKNNKPNLEKIKKLIFELKDFNIYFGNFPSEIRPDFVDENTMELISKYCNNNEISIGAQTGSERLLKICRRGHGVEDIINSVEIAIEKNLSPIVDFIAGLPYENEEDRKKTLEMIREITSMGAIAHVQPFKPLPGTPYSEKYPGNFKGCFKKEFMKLYKKGKIIF